jgi:O-antigen/teichoic acid export membrane protein
MLLGGANRPEVIAALAVYGAVAIPGQLREHFLMIARTEERFGLIAGAAVSVAVLYGTLAIFGSWYWGIYGFLVAVAVQRLFRTAAVWYFVRSGTTFAIHRADLSALIVSGFPMAMAAMAFSLATTADDLMVLALLGQEALGVYSIAILGRAYLWQVGNALGSVWGARIQYLLGRDQDEAALSGLILRQGALISLVLPLSFGPMVIVAETAVFSFLPEFAEGVIPLRILSIAVFLRVIRGLPGNYMIALGKERLALIFGVIAAVTSLAAATLALELGFGLAGAAFAAVAGATVHFAATATYVAARTPHAKVSAAAILASLTLPGIYMVAVISVSDHLSPTTVIPVDGFHVLREFAQRLILYGVAMIPIVVLAYHRWLKNSQDRASTPITRRT